MVRSAGVLFSFTAPGNDSRDRGVCEPVGANSVIVSSLGSGVSLSDPENRSWKQSSSLRPDGLTITNDVVVQ